MGNVTIDDHDISDDDDFMDEHQSAERRRQEKERRREPHHKYKDVLQELADRTANEIVIDLDDVHSVRGNAGDPSSSSTDTRVL